MKMQVRTACILALFCVATVLVSPAQTFTKLRDFTGPNGADPGTPIQGANGNLYGMAVAGGNQFAPGVCAFGCGNVFEISPEGTSTTLYNFCSLANCADGATTVHLSQAGLALGSNGNFYGTTLLAAPTTRIAWTVAPPTLRDAAPSSKLRRGAN